MKKQIKLPKEFLDNWVKALRSGDYIQGDIALYHSDLNTYCCLGVACAVVGAEKNIINHTDMIYNIPNDYLKKLPLPEILKEDSEIVDILVALNDSSEDAAKFENESYEYLDKEIYDFKDIAKFLELNTETY